MYRRRRRKFKIGGGEEIRPSTECTYLGTKIDQLGDNTRDKAQDQ